MTRYPRFVFKEFPQSQKQDGFALYKDLWVDKLVQDATELVSTSEVLDARQVESQNVASVDVDKIRAEAYQEGLRDAEKAYEERIREAESVTNFKDLLKTKLEAITCTYEVRNDALKALLDLSVETSRKLHLILPVDFAKILSDLLLSSLSRFAASGHVKLYIHPDMKVLTEESLNIEGLAHLKQNLEIVQDTSLEVHDCKLEWGESRIIYDREALIQETDAILENLKN
jgi:flagellar biosynthesis/type III secretory pathway protein FliH